jgi:hypothetical protein
MAKSPSRPPTQRQPVRGVAVTVRPVRGSGTAPASAAQHADAARDHARLAAHHSEQAAALARDQQREAASKPRRPR